MPVAPGPDFWFEPVKPDANPRQVKDPLTDNQMRDRVKMLLRTGSAEGQNAEQSLIGPPMLLPDQALQVLTLAQRTAEEHLAVARRQADQIRGDAQGAASKIGEDAQQHAKTTREQAERMLSEARINAERIAQAARAQADEIRQEASAVLNNAKDEADGIVNAGREQANQLNAQARYQYEDAVGGLEVKRAALQRQIEALEEFDREYRRRLSGFLQGQLRALWAEEPQAAALPDGGQLSLPGSAD